MIIPQNNVFIGDPSRQDIISLSQTRDTLTDTEIYQRFVYNIENSFRKSLFYKGYKSHLMSMGLNRSQGMAGITSEMVDGLDLHHHLPRLKDAAIMIIEHRLKTVGCVNTFEVIQDLEYCHRKNMMSVIFLTPTEHQKFHASPADFISLSQCVGDYAKFIEIYGDGLTLDICMRMLLQFKLEEQHGMKSFSPNMIKARDKLLDWSNYTTMGYGEA